MVPKSSIVNPEPPAVGCESCGQPRLNTIDQALCWVCFHLHANAVREAQAETKLYEFVEKETS